MDDQNTALKTIAFRLDDKGTKLFADVSPLGDNPLPDARAIEQQLAADGLAELHLNDGAIASLLQLTGETSKPVSIEIGERRDAEYLIDISDDGMQAWLTIIPARGGQPASQQGLDEAMEEAGLSNGKIIDSIDRAVKEGLADKLLIACGKEPVAGEDSRFEKLYEETFERKPEIDEKGRAHYHSLGNIATVEPGDPVMRRHPPTDGKPGITVRGEPIAAQPGENIMYAAGLQGVRADDTDPNLLYATIAGHPVAFENGVNVDSMYVVDNVDLTTGDIDFDGSLKINHDVRQGVTVKADGDIFIGGAVEAATIEAGGDIEISGGVIGHKENQQDNNARQWSTRISAGKSMQIQFAENAVLRAAHNIVISEVVTRCDLRAEDSIMIGAEGCKKGYILGGEIRANNRIQAVVAGSQASIPTHLYVGYRIPDIHAEIDTLKKQITHKEELLLKLNELVRRLESGMMQDSGKLLEQANDNTNAVKAAIAERKNRIIELNKQLQQLLKSTIEIGQRIHTNVHGHIGSEELRIQDETTGGRFRLEGGKVVFSH